MADLACVDGKNHYEVISPEMCDDRGWEWGPPEYGCDWALVLAANKREAKILTIRGDVVDGGFEDWPDQARSDGICPFSGLKVNLSVCSHGVCWGCKQDCIACHRADDLAFLGINA